MTGTPTAYLNGVLLSDTESLEALLEAVAAAGTTFLPDGVERAVRLSRLR